MTISTSQYLQYIRNPFEWWCSHVMRRIPLGKATALQLGIRYHEGMDPIFRNGTLPSHAAALTENLLKVDANEWEAQHIDADRLSRFRSESRVITNLVANFDMSALPFELGDIHGVEHTMSLALAGHTVMGRADVIASPKDSRAVYHIQHRTFAYNRNRDAYFATRALDPYELLYRYLIEAQPFMEGRIYAGTIMLLGIKHSSLDAAKRAMTGRNPVHVLFDARPVSVRPEHLSRLLDQLIIVGNQMTKLKDCRTWPKDTPFERFDTWLNRGGSKSAYFDVYMGRASLDDPALFTDAPQRTREVEVSADAEA